MLLASSQGLGAGLSQTVPVVVQNSAMTINTSGIIVGHDPNGTIVANTGDAAMSGGTYTRYTRNVSDVDTVLLVGVNLLPGTPPGNYRILMRYRTSHASDTWKLAITQASGASPAYRVYTGDTIDVNGPTTGPFWADMGVFRIPYQAPFTDPSGAFNPGGTTPGIGFALVMMEPSGVAAHTFDIDCFLFVPAGVDQALATRWSTTATDKSLPSGSYKMALDGPADDRYLLDGSGVYLPGIGPAGEGGLPTLMPGADNSIHWLQHVGTGYNDARTLQVTGTNDTLGNSTVVTWRYYPRYLWLRPAGT